MYLRTVRAKGAEGVEFEYIRLVEAHWENGRSKLRVIANLCWLAGYFRKRKTR